MWWEGKSSQNKICERKKNTRRSKQTVTKKQTGAPGPTLSASMFYLAPICSLTTPIWFFFYCKKSGMGLGQKQTFIHFLSPKAAPDAENLTARNRDTQVKKSSRQVMADVFQVGGSMGSDSSCLLCLFGSFVRSYHRHSYGSVVQLWAYVRGLAMSNRSAKCFCRGGSI